LEIKIKERPSWNHSFTYPQMERVCKLVQKIVVIGGVYQLPVYYQGRIGRMLHQHQLREEKEGTISFVHVK
jgi:hypothetical protein